MCIRDSYKIEAHLLYLSKSASIFHLPASIFHLPTSRIFRIFRIFEETSFLMRIISYNVNGIRAAFTKDFLGWLKVADPDIICIQESKAGNDQIDIESLEKIGYKSYWHSAQRKGYSGVGIASKVEPKHIESVSYTHLDVYKRQGLLFFNFADCDAICEKFIFCRFASV